MKKYKGMIPDYNIDTIASSEEEAIQNIIAELKNKFNRLTESEIIEELGIIIYKE